MRTAGQTLDNDGVAPPALPLHWGWTVSSPEGFEAQCRVQLRALCDELGRTGKRRLPLRGAGFTAIDRSYCASASCGASSPNNAIDRRAVELGASQGAWPCRSTQGHPPPAVRRQALQHECGIARHTWPNVRQTSGSAAGCSQNCARQRSAHPLAASGGTACRGLSVPGCAVALRPCDEVGGFGAQRAGGARNARASNARG